MTWHGRVGGSVACFSLTVLSACNPPPSAERRPDEVPTASRGRPSSRASSETVQPFALQGTPSLLLSPEGYYATAMAVAPDDTFVLTPGSLGTDGSGTLYLGRYTPAGKPLWNRTLTGDVWMEKPWLATSGDGDISLWVKLGRGGDFGAGPEPTLQYGLARYSADGQFRWVREAGCYETDPHVDATGAVVVLQMAGCQSESQTEFLQRFTPSGELGFQALARRDLQLYGERHVVSPDGATLVAGANGAADAPGAPRWVQLGTDGTQLTSGIVRGAQGFLAPLQLTADGRYLALLWDLRGTGYFAGQTLSCIRDSYGSCLPLLLSGDVRGREDSAVALSSDERVLWVSPAREIVTVSTDEAGTGSVLRRRSSSAQLLATYVLPSLSASRPDGPNVQVAQVAPLADGTLLVLGTLVGEAELGGARVQADWSRIFLLRVAL